MINNDRIDVIGSFFSELDRQCMGYMVLRNYKEISEGKEKDVDILSATSDFNRLSDVFVKCVTAKGWVPIKIRVVKNGLYLNCVIGKKNTGISQDQRAIQIHVVSYISIKTSHLQTRVNGYTKRIWFHQVSIKREKVSQLEFNIPSDSWRLLFLVNNYRIKKKSSYLSEIFSLLNRGVVDKLGGTHEVVEKLLESKDNDGLIELAGYLYNHIVNKASYFEVSKEVSYLFLENIMSLFRGRGIIIIFSGPDGAGKSTTSRNLVEYLECGLGLSVYCFKDIAPVGHYFGRHLTRIQEIIRGVPSDLPTSTKQIQYRDREPRNKLTLWKVRRLSGLLFYIGQYYIGYIFLHIRTVFGQNIVIDTSIFDRFVKSHRPRFPWLEKIFVPLLPAGDAVFHLVASPDNIISRKPELSKSEIINYYKIMHEIFSLKSNEKIVFVKSDLGLDIACDEVNNIVVAHLSKKVCVIGKC